ncbi:MAG: adenylosuccinate synthase [Christensenellales bacterium]|nr:adenylosuccinate synthase [Christensenellales bacterium]
MLTAIVGINWGDEGKGRMVDLLSEEQDVIVRYQGGNNAGHTVVNERGKFVLNLLPSGILREDKVNVMGNGMVIDVHHLAGEIEKLRAGGVTVTPDNLKISDRAVICFPYNVQQDCLEEDRLADRKFGSTRRGIAPIYADKYMKKAIRMGDLLHPAYLKSRIEEVLDWKNLCLAAYPGAKKYTAEEISDWLAEFGDRFKPYICDAGRYIGLAAREGKNIMFEAQLGALRDIDFGIYPYTSSSNTIAAYAPVGAGVPDLRLDRTIGIMKAYSSCVGEGPFTAEMFGDEAVRLREAGGEYGAATGRPRRVGGFDVVASRYGCRVQGADELALTKLDVLDGFDRIPVVDAYDCDGELTDEFPFGERLNGAKPHTVYMEGWKTLTSDCRRFSDLPSAARAYVDYVEKQVGCEIKYVSVGAERDQIIIR